MAWPDSRKRRLTGRKIDQEAGCLHTQLGRHLMRHPQIQPGIAIGMGSKCFDSRQGPAQGAIAQLFQRLGERVEAGMLEERLPIAQRLKICCVESGQRAEQFAKLVDELQMIPARSIPLEEPEFRIVMPSLLFAAKSRRDLEDRPAARAEQPLHGEFR